MTTNPDATRPDAASGAGLSPTAALQAAAAQFRFYERQHTEKGTEDGRTKAAVNAAFAETMEAALSASHTDAAAGWADISTAPRDKTEVIVWAGPTFKVCTAAFNGVQWRTSLYGIEPTHWMPCPEPPNAIAHRRMAGGEGAGAAGLTAEEQRALLSFTSVCATHAERPDHTPILFQLGDLRALGRIAAARAQAATAPAGGGAARALREIAVRGDTRSVFVEIEDIAARLDGFPDSQAWAASKATPDAPAKTDEAGEQLAKAMWGIDLKQPADAPAKPGQGGEGALREVWVRAIVVSTNCAKPGNLIVRLGDGWTHECDVQIAPSALSAPPADGALRSALEKSTERLHSLSIGWGGKDYEGMRRQVADNRRAALTTAAPADGAPVWTTPPVSGTKARWARALEKRPLAVVDLEYVTISSWGEFTPLTCTLREVAGIFPMGWFDPADGAPEVER